MRPHPQGQRRLVFDRTAFSQSDRGKRGTKKAGLSPLPFVSETLHVAGTFVVNIRSIRLNSCLRAETPKLYLRMLIPEKTANGYNVTLAEEIFKRITMNLFQKGVRNILKSAGS